VAVDLAGRFDAMLIGLTAGLVQPVVDPYSGVMAGALLESGQEELNADLKSAEAAFAKALAASTVRHEFRSRLDLPAQAVIAAAAAADLVVLGRRPPGLLRDPYLQIAPGDVLMGTGRPVLLVPPDVTSVAASRVLVAWKDTLEARRAVADALPFLQRAKQVLVIEISSEADDGASLSDVEGFLRRHGLDPAARRVPVAGASPERQLLDLVDDEGADLIVAGAYGHARLREWMFGGMTRLLLAESPVPVLFSH
jgi:nucleotide-binding universal stress UspA family protein